MATHGRDFWVLDDISVLRQITPEVAGAEAFLFKPSDAIETPVPSENGTPLPKDEAFGENPPYGAYIDYDLKGTTAGPVTIEILDALGHSMRRWSSEERPAPVKPDTLNIPAFWVRALGPPASGAGMHRWVWDLRGAAPTAGARGPGGPGGGVGFGGRGGAMVPPGAYTVRLTVNGKTYTQSLAVRPDPRLKD